MGIWDFISAFFISRYLGWVVLVILVLMAIVVPFPEFRELGEAVISNRGKLLMEGHVRKLDRPTANQSR